MIVVAGEALMDLLVQPDGSVRAVPGGGSFNAARTIARLGQPVAFLGCLSDDGFGRTLWGALEDDGVDLSFVERTTAPTTLAIASLDPAGIATYNFHTAGTSAAGLSTVAVAGALANHPRALHVGSLGVVLEPMAGAIVEGVARADRSTLVLLDPNCRPVAIADRPSYLARLDSLVVRADVVKLSRDDLDYLAPDATPITAARALLARGPAAVLLTDGARPVTVLTPTFEFEVEVPAVAVVDTVGAGDAFGGAFLARWIERDLGRAELADREVLRDAVAWANRVAARTCGRAGADPPRREELA